jgi:hypothetical protein
VFGDPARMDTDVPGEPGAPPRVVLRSSVFATGDVLLAIERSWWEGTPPAERAALAAAHLEMTARRLRRQLHLPAFVGAAGGLATAGLGFWDGSTWIGAAAPFVAVAGAVGTRLGLGAVQRLRLRDGSAMRAIGRRLHLRLGPPD